MAWFCTHPTTTAGVCPICNPAWPIIDPVAYSHKFSPCSTCVEAAVQAKDDEIERLRAVIRSIGIECSQPRILTYGDDVSFEYGKFFAYDKILNIIKAAALIDQDAKSDADYIRSEAERLPFGTAARFLAALDAMDGATEPLEGGES